MSDSDRIPGPDGPHRHTDHTPQAHGQVAELGHPLARCLPRDPNEPHRAASPLELLYDLTLVVAFSVAGAQFAHLVAAGHILVGLAGFLFSMFAIRWAWINFAWFASAYDNDGWLYRITTMVQMGGVLVRMQDSLYAILLAATALVIGAAVVMAFAGAPLAWCLVVLGLAPWVTVVGFEHVGHRRAAAALERL